MRFACSMGFWVWQIEWCDHHLCHVTHRGFQNLSSDRETDRQTERQTDTTEIIYLYVTSRTVNNNNIYIQCESKKVAPLKLFAIFSLMVNLCNRKLSQLLPKHIPRFTPILVHYLNICTNCVIFTSNTPQILTIPFQLLRNSWIFH